MSLEQRCKNKSYYYYYYIIIIIILSTKPMENSRHPV